MQYTFRCTFNELHCKHAWMEISRSFSTHSFPWQLPCTAPLESHLALQTDFHGAHGATMVGMGQGSSLLTISMVLYLHYIIRCWVRFVFFFFNDYWKPTYFLWLTDAVRFFVDCFVLFCSLQPWLADYCLCCFLCCNCHNWFCCFNLVLYY